MQAGEFAREKGVYDPYHEAVFKAFFTDCLDIGNYQVIADIITSLGLEPDQLEKAVQNQVYVRILEQTKKKASKSMVTAAPTFFIEGGAQITGAQPLETFREAFDNAVPIHS